jgi:hypothetical protein
LNRKTTPPVALVTQRADLVSGCAEMGDAIDQRLAEWLSVAGAKGVAASVTAVSLEKA